MSYDDGMSADEIAEWERADAEFDITKDLALALAEDVWRSAGPRDTVHRLAARDGEAHREAAFPTGPQVAITLGHPTADEADARLDALAFDLTATLQDLLADDQPCRLTLVSALINDRRTVEIVRGLAVGIEWTAQHGTELVRFDDGDYVYLDDVISVRIEA